MVKYMRRCLTSLIIKEIQIETTVGYYFRLIRVVSIKNKKKAGEDIG